MKKILLFVVILSLCLCASGCSGLYTLKGMGGASIEETLLFEHEGFAVTAAKIEENSLLGISTMTIDIKNDSETDYSLYCDTVYVNGCVAVNYLDTQVFAGKSATEELMLLDRDTKEMYSAQKAGLIECYFYLYEGENLVDTFLASVKTNSYDSELCKVKAEGALMYDKDGIRIYCKNVFTGDDAVYSDANVVLVMENNTGKNLYFDIESVSVGDKMAEGYLYSSVFAGTTVCDFAEITAKDVTKDSEISFSLIIYDLDTGEKIGSTGVMNTDGKSEQ